MTVNTQPGRGTPRDWETMGGGYDADGKLQLGKIATERGVRRRLELQLRRGAARRQGGAARTCSEDRRAQDLGHELGRRRRRRRSSRTPTSSTCRACATTARSPPASRPAPTMRSSSAKKTASCCVTRSSARARSTAGAPARTRRSISTSMRNVSQHCIGCFPRIEHGVAPACVRQCPGRAAFVGFLDDAGGPIHKLVEKWKVALPLHPEYGTEPKRLLRAAAVAGAAARGRQLRRGRSPHPAGVSRETLRPDGARRCSTLAASSTRSGAAGVGGDGHAHPSTLEGRARAPRRDPATITGDVGQAGIESTGPSVTARSTRPNVSRSTCHGQ